MSSVWQGAHTCGPRGAGLTETCLLGEVSGATQVLGPPLRAPFLVLLMGVLYPVCQKLPQLGPAFQADDKSERPGQVQLKVGPVF